MIPCGYINCMVFEKRGEISINCSLSTTFMVLLLRAVLASELLLLMIWIKGIKKWIYGRDLEEYSIKKFL